MRWWLGLIFCLCAAPALAHLTPTTSIEFDFIGDHADVRITIPVGEIGYAYGRPTLNEAALRQHFEVRSIDGQAWKIGAMRSRTKVQGGSPDQIIDFKITPPPGQSSRALKLHYDGVIDKISSHVVLVMAQSDFSGGVLQGNPKMLGALQNGKAELAINLGNASKWIGFMASLRLGMAHIAEGFDHLLFLLSLLLPAPLIANSGRWQRAAGRKQTIRRLALIITAFTIGHSLTLIGGAFFGWSLPSQPVEIGIALSILISAIHAARPLFPGREALVAGGFGLIHGLAFATVIGSFSLQPLDKAVAILGFNLGIEAVQLIVVAAVLPLLLWLAPRPAYHRFRQGGALFAGVAALFWLWQRM
jgi:HupE / UreJ protein